MPLIEDWKVEQRIFFAWTWAFYDDDDGYVHCMRHRVAVIVRGAACCCSAVYECDFSRLAANFLRRFSSTTLRCRLRCATVGRRGFLVNK